MACEKMGLGTVSVGWVLTHLGHVKDLGPHPDGNGKSSKRFRQRSAMNRLVFYSNHSGL